MEKPLYGDTRPIAALATPLAESALAIIRTSGGGSGNESESAVELVARVFSRPAKLINAPANTIVHGWIASPEAGPASPKTKIDEVLVSVFRAPVSYTGEDCADICCHGGIATTQALMAALLKAGFREALPGEFTFRAFMNGKIDLTRAESVMELVAAKTHRGAAQALRRLAGVLERELKAIKALLVTVLAGAEIYLDYSEDEFLDSHSDEEAGRLPDKNLAEEAAARLAGLADLWRRERIYSEGALVVLAGRPNAGKSSLFNYLIKEDRSIVTNVPGTTRDWIEASFALDGIPLRLVDTAGLRSFARAPGGEDEAERIGIERTKELLANAHVVLYVIDGTEGITEEDHSFLSEYFCQPERETHLIALWNKADRVPLGVTSGTVLPCELLAVSAKSGEGIPALLRAVAALLETPVRLGTVQQCDNAAAGPGTTRQKELIDAALAAVEEALDLSEQDEPLDLITPCIRSAIDNLGEITGEVFHNDILEEMFSRFCVGK